MTIEQMITFLRREREAAHTLSAISASDTTWQRAAADAHAAREAGFVALEALLVAEKQRREDMAKDW